MRFQPKTEKEIAEAGLWQPGVYDFEVVSAEEAVSKAGSDMIKLTVRIFNDEGENQIVFDYLLDAMAGKLRHAAQAFNLLHDYENGGINSDDCVGKTGKCKVAIQKDKNGQYPDRNSIVDYIAQASDNARQPAPRARQPAGAGLDDEIPF